MFHQAHAALAAASPEATSMIKRNPATKDAGPARITPSSQGCLMEPFKCWTVAATRI